MKFETLQIHAGQTADSATNAMAVPIYQTSSYVFNDTEHAQKLFALEEGGNIYTRIMNPTTDVLEQRVAALEGGAAALAVSSGMAACALAIQNIAYAGDNIVSATTIYGGTYNLFAHTLPKYGIKTTFFDADNLDELRNAINDKTKAVFIETLGNPNSTIADIGKIAEIAHEYNIPLIVDNTFATPYFHRPIEHGADIVIHSATKFIGGHGTSIGGIIVDSGKFDWKKSEKFPSLTEPDASYHGVSYTETFGSVSYIVKLRVQLLRDLGSCMSPFNAFLFLQGVETLSLRIERQVENAKKIVEYLVAHELVEKVNHPLLETNSYHQLYKKYFPNGGASIFTFEIKGTEADARNFIDKLAVFTLLANVADVKSLVIHPASTTHSQMTKEELLSCGITPTTVRLSIGIEHIEDLLQDLEQAFQK